MTPSESTALPLVSIGMPVYNGAHTVRRALDSLLAQDCGDFELVISDNASTDGSWDVLQEYAARDPRIKLSRNNQNRGAAYNFNRVFELAQGEYFMWAACDDWWETGFISVCLQRLVADPAAVGCYAGDYPIPGDRVAQMASAAPWERVQGVARGWAGSSVMIYGVFRRDALGQALPVLNLEAPDGVILLRLAACGPLIYLSQPMHHYIVSRRNAITRLRSMGRKANFWNLLKWDVGLARAMIRAVWHAPGIGFGLRLHMAGTALTFAAGICGWPYPMRVISRYIATIIPASAFYPVFKRLHAHPRLLNQMRRLTGMHLNLPPDV